VAYKAYNSNELRCQLINDGVLPITPNRLIRVDLGHFVQKIYRELNCIEPLIGPREGKRDLP
jgi:hypothetical protein